MCIPANVYYLILGQIKRTAIWYKLYFSDETQIDRYEKIQVTFTQHNKFSHLLYTHFSHLCELQETRRAELRNLNAFDTQIHAVYLENIEETNILFVLKLFFLLR